MPVDMNRIFRYRAILTDRQMGFALAMIVRCWEAEEAGFGVYAPFEWIKAQYGHHKSDLEVQQALWCGALWWSDQDCMLYSPYVLELAGRSTPRSPIPKWMKRHALERALRWGEHSDSLACHFCECDVTDGPFHYDHLLPLSRGGINHPCNIVVSCPTCNLAKAARTEDEFEALRREAAQ